jgi:hypothetical protein
VAAEKTERALGPRCRHHGHAGAGLSLAVPCPQPEKFERNILAFCGVGPIRDTLLGGVEQAGADTRARWLERMAGEAARLPAAPRAWATATAESTP